MLLVHSNASWSERLERNTAKLLYLDDIIVFSSSVEEHLSRMVVVLSRLEQQDSK